MRNQAQQPGHAPDRGNPGHAAELAKLHAKLDLVREVRERELRRKAVESLNRQQVREVQAAGILGNRLAMAMAALLLVAVAIAGAVSLAVFLWASNRNMP